MNEIDTLLEELEDTDAFWAQAELEERAKWERHEKARRALKLILEEMKNG